MFTFTVRHDIAEKLFADFPKNALHDVFLAMSAKYSNGWSLGDFMHYKTWIID